MATTKNITMKQFNGTDYDTLYPKTKIEQVEGAYTQQQILADSTKSLYGLGTNAVPNDVLAWIGRYNQYWWKRTQFVYSPTISGGSTITVIPNSLNERTFYYSDSVIVSKNSITLNNPQSVTVPRTDYSTLNSTLIGKYFKMDSADSADTYYASSSTEFKFYNTYPTYLYAVNLSTVSVQSTPEAVDYVYSNNRNEYPDNGESGDFDYLFLGIPFDNAVNGVKIKRGSYVGTGTSALNLTFEVSPYLLFLSCPQFTSGVAYIFTREGYIDVDSNTYTKVSYGSYLTDEGLNMTDQQTSLNTIGHTFNFTVIGI